MKLAVALTFCLAGAAAARAKTITVAPGQSIQAAVDAAAAGDRIVVQPGTYHESGAAHAVTITKSGIHLVAAARRGKPVVIEQAGTQREGIWASPADTLAPADVEQPPCGLSGARLTDVEVSGFTVQGFPGFGVYLACVDGFRIRGDTARGNNVYAIFPVRSSKGRMTRNTASGTLSDACIYVGQDDRILVDHNRATDCQIGLQIENSTHIRMRDNVAMGNTAGMIVDILNGRQVKQVSDNVVSGNLLADNNRANTAPPDEDTSQIPPGIGVILNGPAHTIFTHNTITGNGFAGMTFVNFCIGFESLCADPTLDIDPYPTDNRITGNRFQQNKVDVIYLPGTGAMGNCFVHNVPANLAVTGGPLPTTCPRRR